MSSSYFTAIEAGVCGPCSADDLGATGGPEPRPQSFQAHTDSGPAEAQSRSGFFTRLPPEIRQQVYTHLWDLSGSVQHVHRADQELAGSPLTHCACITPPGERDVRDEETHRLLSAWTNEVAMDESHPMQIDANDWIMRLFSSWCNHWGCEEGPPGFQNTTAREDYYSPFLATLLTCKRMYDECRCSMYSRLTFSFIGPLAMRRFLLTVPHDSLARVKGIHLLWHAPASVYVDPRAIEAAEQRRSLGGSHGRDIPVMHEPDAELAAEVLAQWRSLWDLAATRLPSVRDLVFRTYPVYSRFPMPSAPFFRELHRFAHLDRDRFVVQLAWDWQYDPGREEEADNLPAVPDFLQNTSFRVERELPVEYDQTTWRRLWMQAGRARRASRRLVRRRELKMEDDARSSS